MYLFGISCNNFFTLFVSLCSKPLEDMPLNFLEAVNGIKTFNVLSAEGKMERIRHASEHRETYEPCATNVEHSECNGGRGGGLKNILLGCFIHPKYSNDRKFYIIRLLTSFSFDTMSGGVHHFRYKESLFVPLSQNLIQQQKNYVRNVCCKRKEIQFMPARISKLFK